MNIRSINILMLALSLTLFLGCKENSNSEKDTQESKASDSKETEGHNEEEGGMRSVNLSEMKFNSLGIMHLLFT